MMEATKHHEVLTITMEECAEVIVECSKIIRFGLENNTANLEKEIGDLLCMIDLIKEAGLTNHQNVETAIKNKREKLKKWSNLNV